MTSSWFTRLQKFIVAHKIVSIVVGLLVIYGAYKGYGVLATPPAETRYVTSIVATGTVIATMSESGQVSASSNVSVTSKSSGEVLSIPVAAGQHVQTGAALAFIDPTTAEQTVASAKQALTAAQISLATAEGNVTQSRVSAYNDISAAFLNLPSIMSGLDTVLHGSTVPSHQAELNENAYSNLALSYDPSVADLEKLTDSAYQKANTSYLQALADFRSTPRTADAQTMNALITETYLSLSDLADALRESTGFLNAVNTALVNHQANVPSTLAGHINSLTGYSNTVAGYLTSLSNDSTNLMSDTGGLGDPLAIQSAKLAVQEKQDALSIAEQALADTIVRAPFAGTVGKLSVQQYQTISNGAAVVTLVSDNQSVALSVNEVDAAQLKVGQKATITFDALPNISIAGTVSSVDAIGTVTSGVVSYNATVTFDTPNSGVKSGMSASTNIITGVATGLVVPQSAVKTAGNQSYVLVFNPQLASSTGSTGATSPIPPVRVNVTTGLSNTADTIITDGLTPSTQVVTKVISGAGASATTPSSATRSTSVFGGAGAPRGTGGATHALSGD